MIGPPGRTTSRACRLAQEVPPGAGGVVRVLCLRWRHEDGDRAAGAQIDNAPHVVAVQVGEDDALDLRSDIAELLGDGSMRLDRLGAAQELEWLSKGERLVTIHPQVDQQDAAVGPLEHEGGVTHDVGLVRPRVASGIEDRRARHRLTGGIDDRQTPRPPGLGHCRGRDGLRGRERRPLAADGNVSPGQSGDRDHHGRSEEQRESEKEAFHHLVIW